MSGKLIVLEGTDGSGKTTQLNLLLERMNKEGMSFEHLHFPKHEKDFGKVVDSYLRGEYGKKEDLSPEFVAMLYLTDFFNSKKQMEETLNNGKHIILSRFFSSTLTYQVALAKKEDKQKVWSWIRSVVSPLPQPDKVLVLRVPRSIAEELKDNDSSTNMESYKLGKKKDQHEDDSVFQQDVFNEYERNISLLGWQPIDCVKDGKLLSIEEIHELVWGEVKKVLG